MSAEWVEQPALDQHGIPGRTLAAQREAMGWTVEQVADQLKLAVRQVIALEAGDYACLPSPAVVRGFVRAYAKVVKLDAAPLVAMIALETPAASDLTATTVRRDKPASFSEVRFPTNGKRTSSVPVGPIAVALVVLLGAAVAAWQFGAIPDRLLGGNAPAAGAPAAAGTQASVTVLPAPVQDKTAPGQVDAALVKPGEEPRPVISNAVPLISVPAPVPAPVSAESVLAALPGDALVLQVREDCWIEVRRAKGGPLFSGLVKGGRTETIRVTEPVTLIVGKPDAVDASWRGAAVALPPVPGGKISRVNLK